MRIAICDDEQAIRTRLHSALKSSEAMPSNATISGFPDGESLLECHKENPYNIIFLDIEMPNASGLEVARKIRRADKEAIIVFVTGHLQYASQAIGNILPFDFILKPFDNGSIGDVLNRAIAKHIEQHYLLRIRGSKDVETLVVSEIVFLDAFEGMVGFVTKNGKHYYGEGTLNEYESILSEYGFLRCHQKNLVNMRYIKEIEEASITTTLGDSLDMSTRKRKGCVRDYYRYRTRHMV